MTIKRHLHLFFKKLSNSFLSPRDQLFDYTKGLLVTQMVHAAAHWKIPDLLHKGPQTANTLATTLHLNADSLHRVLRALASVDFFILNSDGTFGNTPVSEVLRTGVSGSLRNFAEHVGSRSHVNAWADFLETVRTGESAFARVHGMSMWKWFEIHPEEGTVFGACMEDLTRLVATQIAQSEVFKTSKVLCDIAGGQGILLKEILRFHPHLQGTIFDSKSVLTRALKNLNPHTPKTSVTFKEGNFFESVPGGFDAYVLKDILHDWNDDQSLKILGNIGKQSQKGGRVLIIEVLVSPLSTDESQTISDVQMMVVCDEGRQRSQDEFAKLLSKAGFAFVDCHDTRTGYSIIEGVFAPN